jgi:hypothetical protein
MIDFANQLIHPTDRPRALAVARHECGHYVAARVLGFKATKLTLTLLLPIGHLGGSAIHLHQKLDTKEQILEFLDRRAQILCAGVMAEATSNGVVDNVNAVKLMESGGGADQDYGKYREVVYLMRNIKYGDTADEGNYNGTLTKLGFLSGKRLSCSSKKSMNS